MDITKLKGHVPDAILEQLPFTMEKFGINTVNRLAHFLGQCHHESGGFKTLHENLNYSADGLKSIFPKYFPGVLSESYARNPQKIANKVYGGRMGNGDETSGDGWKFRGRGVLQVTGKENYTKFSKFIGEDCVANPDLLENKYALASGAFFFTNNNLWTICDKGTDDATIGVIGKRINGGSIGADDRLKQTKIYETLLS